jgi:hypothetical protein
MAMLTAQRETFALALAEGSSRAAAYRKAYPRSLAWKDTSVWDAASKLASTPEVQQRVGELQAAAAAASEVTLASHVATLASLRDEARAARQFGAAIAAETARGKASGLYSERLHLMGKDGGPVQVERVERVIVDPKPEHGA